jgi:hypothetical protein
LIIVRIIPSVSGREFFRLLQKFVNICSITLPYSTPLWPPIATAAALVQSLPSRRTSAACSTIARRSSGSAVMGAFRPITNARVEAPALLRGRPHPGAFNQRHPAIQGSPPPCP